jgi:hypothetical protein
MPITINTQIAGTQVTLACQPVWDVKQKKWVCSPSSGSAGAPEPDPIQDGGGTGGGDLFPDDLLKALLAGRFRKLSATELTNVAAPYVANARSLRRSVAALARKPRDIAGMEAVSGVFLVGNHVVALGVDPDAQKPRAPRSDAEIAAVAESLASMATKYEAVGAAFKQAAWHAEKLGNLLR